MNEQTSNQIPPETAPTPAPVTETTPETTPAPGRRMDEQTENRTATGQTASKHAGRLVMGVEAVEKIHIRNVTDERFSETVREIYPTGFSAIDKELSDTKEEPGGLVPKGLYVIGAISAIGKSTFVLQIADQMATQGIPVLYATLEMTTEELASKSISRYTATMATGATPERMKKSEMGVRSRNRWKHYTSAEQAHIMNAQAAYSLNGTGKIAFLEQKPGERISVSDIRITALEMKEKAGESPVVVVDYLQLLPPTDTHATDKANMDMAITDMKSLAMELSAPVICISSFNRSSYTAKVSTAAFKESGAIEYTADAVIAL